MALAYVDPFVALAEACAGILENCNRITAEIAAIAADSRAAVARLESRNSTPENWAAGPGGAAVPAVAGDGLTAVPAAPELQIAGGAHA